MKKIIFILISLFVFSNVQALSSFYLGEKVLNMKLHEYTDYDTHTGIPFVLRRSDGEFTYCLNPFLKYNTTELLEEYDYNTGFFGVDDKQLDRMNLIAYYGYGYNGHTDLKWYGITQFLVWRELDLNDIYFVDVETLDRVNTYDNEVLEIEKLVNEYYTLPSISNKLEYTINSSYEEIDLNSVLNKYEIVESNIDSKIENNKLIINTSDSGNYKIKLRRNSPVNKDYKIYYIEGYQPLLLPGKVNDIEFYIDIEVISGSITINKEDSENIHRTEASLEGAIYGLYEGKELLNTVSTNTFGNAFLEDLKLGNYYIKEITPSLGYELDNNIYEINLTKENKDIVITSKEDVIEGNLIINKYYGENLEDGAEFDIYNVNDELVTNIVTDNGISNTTLEYGYYYVIQTKGIDGYEFVDKFDFKIDKSKDYLYNLYDVLEVEVPDTKRIDYYRYLPIIFIITGLILIKKATRYE